MKLKKLYCNKPSVFPSMHFNDGLNVLLGEIRDPKNRGKTTHNIGKTTFVKLIDFCLLKGHSTSAFWRKNPEHFQGLTFFLELSFHDGFITIMRSFEKDTRVGIKKHHESDQNFIKSNAKWDHKDITINNARDMLDGYLNFDIIKPWDFRKITSYLLRIQDDYSDIFRLAKHAGRDVDWKPPLSQIMGLDGKLVEKGYNIDDEIEEIKKEIINLEGRVDEFKDDPDKLNGLIQIKEEELSRFENKLNEFDFKDVEDEINKDLVDSIESDISELNSQKYYLDLEIKSINESINEKSSFSLRDTEKIFSEAGIYFEDQIKKSYKELLDFNRRITKERIKYLKVELKEKEAIQKEIEEKLDILNSRRINSLSKIKERETFNKYKDLGNELSKMKVSLYRLQSIKEDLSRLENKKDILERKEKERSKVTKKMQSVLKSPSRRYLDIKSTYNNFIKEVINRTAIINTRVNSSGNYSFDAPFIDADGTSTSEDDGHTFKKLQCIAFDSAIVMNSLDKKFPHFAIHDGVLETLENRMRLNLLELFRKQASSGCQEIITVLDSHLPERENVKFEFRDEEIIRVLHDEGDDGRLFRMPSW